MLRVVKTHLDTRSQTPAHAHDTVAWQCLQARLQQDGRPLILDSFCGTGHSTHALAARHPQHLVVGVDKSAHRLGKHPYPATDNYMLLQADCAAIWRRLADTGVQLSHHYLFYPNPWPKARHLGRRIHGHASFADLLALGGIIELRSNWQIYVEEFGAAMHYAGRYGHIEAIADPTAAISLFETKYRSSGHALWRYLSTSCK